jgi:hypothetical protein
VAVQVVAVAWSVPGFSRCRHELGRNGWPTGTKRQGLKTQQAHTLGMTGATYVNASGLPDDGQVTNAQAQQPT